MQDYDEMVGYTDEQLHTHSTFTPQAVILAAGRGRRLGSRVEEIPKCLLKVGGRSLLDHQLDMLAAVGIQDICIVTGYHRRVVTQACRGRAHFIDNPDWSGTNSLYSFWLTRNWVNRSVVVMNCDVLAEQTVLKRLLQNPVSSFAYDSSSGGEDEHMKVELSGGHLKSMSKSLDASKVHGENVGMLYFSPEDARELYACAKTILDRRGREFWMASAVQELSRTRELSGIDISGSSWIEIDYPEDLEQARNVTWPLIERRRKPRISEIGFEITASAG